MNPERRIINWARDGVDIATMTMVLRSDGYSDAEIAQAYDSIAQNSTTEVINGSYYIRLDSD